MSVLTARGANSSSTNWMNSSRLVRPGAAIQKPRMGSTLSKEPCAFRFNVVSNSVRLKTIPLSRVVFTITVSADPGHGIKLKGVIREGRDKPGNAQANEVLLKKKRGHAQKVRVEDCRG